MDGTRSAALLRWWAGGRAAVIFQGDKSLHTLPVLTGKAVSLSQGAPVSISVVSMSDRDDHVCKKLFKWNKKNKKIGIKQHWLLTSEVYQQPSQLLGEQLLGHLATASLLPYILQSSLLPQVPGALPQPAGGQPGSWADTTYAICRKAWKADTVDPGWPPERQWGEILRGKTLGEHACCLWA